MSLTSNRYANAVFSVGINDDAAVSTNCAGRYPCRDSVLPGTRTRPNDQRAPAVLVEVRCGAGTSPDVICICLAFPFFKTPCTHHVHSMVNNSGGSSSASSQLTLLTCACAGPFDNQPHNSSTSGFAPQASTSTRPSGKFRT